MIARVRRDGTYDVAYDDGDAEEGVPRALVRALVAASGGAGGALPSFTCPHHACSVCARKADAAGGMLFRCEACVACFCEDCLPDDAQIITDNPHFAPLGYVRQKSACFVTCSEACAARQNEKLRGSS